MVIGIKRVARPKIGGDYKLISGGNSLSLENAEIMCILISSTLHPDYPFILLSNRDEYFARPTQMATVRPMNNGSQILTPLDLARPERGTWIGITDKGKVAALVNYREELHHISEVSRGILPLQYLTSDLEDDEWYDKLESLLSETSQDGKPVTLSQIGGFTLVYGNLELGSGGKIKPLHLISNRGDRGQVHSSFKEGAIPHADIAGQSTFGLSNSRYNSPWPKVNLGTDLLNKLISKSIEMHYDHDQLLNGCYEVLSTDTFDPEIRDGMDFESKLKEVLNSIFIPPLETHYGRENFTPVGGEYYGTRTQVVILLHRSGQLHYHERDLHLKDSSAVEIRTQHYCFDLRRS